MNITPRSQSQISSTRRVLLAVPESDSHVVVNKLLDYHLRRQGYTVLNLGVCTPVEDMVTAAAQFDPDAIVISSQNGHAYADLARLPQVIRQAGVRRVPVYLGGNLSVGSARILASEIQKFNELGIEVVESFDQMDHLLLLSAANPQGEIR